MEQLLEKNDELSRRLETFEVHPSKEENQIFSGSQSPDESEGRDDKTAETVFGALPHSSSFEQDLYASPVYARVMEGKSNLSISLSTSNSNARSRRSNLSLADVSDISVLSLPITTAEIWNHHHYLAEHHVVSNKHASHRESRCAMSQDAPVPLAKPELNMISLDQSPYSGISGSKIMLLGALNLYHAYPQFPYKNHIG